MTDPGRRGRPHGAPDPAGGPDPDLRPAPQGGPDPDLQPAPQGGPDPEAVELRIRARPAVLVTAGVVAVLAVAGAAGADRPGRVLLGVVVVGALGALAWLAAGPLVVADAGGLALRTGWRAEHLAWSAVTAVRVDEHRRSRALEVDVASAVRAPGGDTTRAGLAETAVPVADAGAPPVDGRHGGGWRDDEPRVISVSAVLLPHGDATATATALQVCWAAWGRGPRGC